MMRGYTTVEQSKKLAEILPIESADMCFYYKENIPQLVPFAKHNNRFYIPCWSLAALLDVLPKIYGLKPMFDLEECSIQYSGIDIYIIASNPVDVCYDTILKLHELKML